jgi:predicted amidohydrolase
MRTLVARGARAIFIPTNNGMPEDRGGAELVMAARETDIAWAKELGVLIVRADVTGRTGELVSYGSSAIIGPGGMVMAALEPMTPGLIGAETRS